MLHPSPWGRADERDRSVRLTGAALATATAAGSVAGRAGPARAGIRAAEPAGWWPRCRGARELDPEEYGARLGGLRPRLFVVGAPRAATTTLYSLLSRHPDIHMTPRKEPGFFHLYGQERPWQGPRDRRGISRIEPYGRLFAAGAGRAVIGEASTVYLYSDRAADRIARCAPDARVIAILRNPIDRAYSNFLQHWMQGRERAGDFAEAMRMADGRLARGWSPFWDYRGMGMYGRQLRRYLDVLPRSSILTLRYEDVVGRPDQVMRDVSGFLGIRHVPVPPPPQGLNAAGLPKNRALGALLQLARRGASQLSGPLRYRAEVALERLIQANLRRPGLAGSVRGELAEAFWKDTEEASRLTGMDLMGWYGAEADGG